jgi:hypothetical protein
MAELRFLQGWTEREPKHDHIARAALPSGTAISDGSYQQGLARASTLFVAYSDAMPVATAKGDAQV